MKIKKTIFLLGVGICSFAYSAVAQSMDAKPAAMPVPPARATSAVEIKNAPAEIKQAAVTAPVPTTIDNAIPAQNASKPKPASKNANREVAQKITSIKPAPAVAPQAIEPAVKKTVIKQE